MTKAEIFLVSEGSYSDYCILAVFTDRESAEAYSEFYPGSVVEDEYPLNPTVKVPVPGQLPYRVEYRPASDKHLVFRIEPDGKFGTVDHWKPHTSYAMWQDSEVYRLAIWAKDETHALKIFSEKKRQYISEQI